MRWMKNGEFDLGWMSQIGENGKSWWKEINQLDENRIEVETESNRVSRWNERSMVNVWSSQYCDRLNRLVELELILNWWAKLHSKNRTQELRLDDALSEADQARQESDKRRREEKRREEKRIAWVRIHLGRQYLDSFSLRLSWSNSLSSQLPSLNSAKGWNCRTARFNAN